MSLCSNRLPPPDSMNKLGVKQRLKLPCINILKILCTLHNKYILVTCNLPDNNDAHKYV